MKSTVRGMRLLSPVTMRRASLVGVMALTIASSAQAQTGTSYTGQEYSSGTTFSSVYSSYLSSTTDTTVDLSTTQTSNQGTRTLSSTGWFGYDVSGATGANNGQFVNPGGGYPTGYEFGGNLVETGTGADGSANVTVTGETNGTASGNTWVKGSAESGGDWNVRANQASFLGGYTNSSNTGSAILNLGSEYTSWASLIGTNTNALLNVQVQGFNTAVSSTSAVFTYDFNGIAHNTSDPFFTGYAGSTDFNEIVITGLKTSTPAGNSTYTAYPNAAFIALDQIQVGKKNVVTTAVPEAGSLALLLPAGLACLAAALRRTRQSK